MDEQTSFNFGHNTPLAEVVIPEESGEVSYEMLTHLLEVSNHIIEYNAEAKKKHLPTLKFTRRKKRVNRGRTDIYETVEQDSKVRLEKPQDVQPSTTGNDSGVQTSATGATGRS